MKYSEEEIAMARSADLCAVASAFGYTVKKIGKYHTIKEMDSVRIYDRSHWYRWSSKTGGSQIDFVMSFGDMDFKEAVGWLLHFVGYDRGCINRQVVHVAEKKQKAEKREFKLPDYAGNNKRLYRYLMGERRIGKEVIDLFVSEKLMYESKGYHNIVFVGTDCNGTPKFASLRGTADADGRSFKCDVAGNDKNYGFHLYREGSNRVVVFEAAIDLLSYLTIYPDCKDSLLALGMVSDAPLERFIEEHGGICEIGFALDNDEAGRMATIKLMEKYYGLDYQVEDVSPPEEFKDYNDWLVKMSQKYVMKR